MKPSITQFCFLSVKGSTRQFILSFILKLVSLFLYVRVGRQSILPIHFKMILVESPLMLFCQQLDVVLAHSLNVGALCISIVPCLVWAWYFNCFQESLLSFTDHSQVLDMLEHTCTFESAMLMRFLCLSNLPLLLGAWGFRGSSSVAPLI